MQGQPEHQHLPGSDHLQPASTQPATTYQIGKPTQFEIKLNKAVNLKTEGNAAFKNHNYHQARTKYQQALQLLQPKSFTGASQNECNRMVELSANLLFNVGTCSFNQNRWREGELMYNEAITVNPYYVKALYKRALCRHHMDQYQGAMEDIKRAYNFDKTNEDIRQAYEMIIKKYNEEAKKDHQKRKQLSSKIFHPAAEKSQSKTKGDKEKQKQKQKVGSGWWMLSLLPLAAAAVYQGIKYLRN